MESEGDEKRQKQAMMKKKKKKKEKKRKEREDDITGDSVEDEDIIQMEDGKYGDEEKEDGGGIIEVKNEKRGDENNKKKIEKGKRIKDGDGVTWKILENETGHKKDRKLAKGNTVEEVEQMKKQKTRKKEKSKKDMQSGLQGNSAEKLATESAEIRHKRFEDNEDGYEGKTKVILKEDKFAILEEGKKEEVAMSTDGKRVKRVRRTKTDIEATNLSENPKPKSKSKRVSFSKEVEVFPSSDEPLADGVEESSSLVWGKRFTPEEDELIKKAVYIYIQKHGLGEKGEHMILNCKYFPEVKNCWKEIGSALPWRPTVGVYYRAHILFERGDKRKWTPEELEKVKKFYAEHGANWKKLAGEMGKHRVHVKDTWRRIKFDNPNKGCWSQEEYQKLFDLVNMDLSLKVHEEKKSKHGMLRDNICWWTIGDKLETRPGASCCLKWYDKISSPMVAKGTWADADDYRLVIALDKLDACCQEDVDWDNLIENRCGDVCLTRWNQMVKCIGHYAEKSFIEQVEVLSKRYCSELLEVREAYDSRPRVP